jgi:hypothetical protein
MLQQFTKAEAADSAQALCQFCREQQSSGEPLRWIAGANPPSLFFHDFPNSHRFPHSRYTPELSQSSGKWGRVTKDSWRAACFGESRRAEFDKRQKRNGIELTFDAQQHSPTIGDERSRSLHVMDGKELGVQGQNESSEIKAEF